MRDVYLSCHKILQRVRTFLNVPRNILAPLTVHIFATLTPVCRMVDTSGIHKVVKTARRRLKLQSALDAGTLAVIPASVGALTTVVLARQGVVGESKAIAVLIGIGLLVLVGALVGFLRSYSTNLVATLIDRHSGLADRLASACAFEKKLATKGTNLDSDTKAMMLLAIADAHQILGKAAPKTATPFRLPKDSRAALAFAVAAALGAGIFVQAKATTPVLTQVMPVAAPPGSVIVATGTRLLSPAGAADTAVYLSVADSEPEKVPALAATIRNLTSNEVEFEIPQDASTGMMVLRVRVGADWSNAIPFEVLDKEDPRAIPEDHIVLEEEDLDYAKDLVAELRETAKANEDLELEQLADELDDLLSKAKKGELTKKQLLEALNKSQDKYMEGSEKAVEETMSDLKKAGKELKKDKLTRELGKSLEQGDLEKAKDELQKLAQKLDDNKLSDKDQKKIGEAMEKAAAKMAKAEKKRDEQQQKRIARQQDRVRKLEKKQDQTKDKNEKEELVRRLNKEKRELKRLQRNKEEQKKDPNKRELKQLRRKMEQAAKDLQRQKKQGNRQKSRREVSKTMRDMARSAGKVSQDKRKMANKQKVATQMGDLKEAMRRAKRKGKKGAKNRFGRNKRRNRDFGQRARGGKGQKGAWKPGQGQGQGKGKGKGQGQGNKPGGKDYGDGHDPNVIGDLTPKTQGTTDDSLQGLHGKGPSTRETILTAAQKGFASRDYQKVFTNYKRVIEESIQAEKVPSGYKYYIKRYFQKIKPQQ